MGLLVLAPNVHVGGGLSLLRDILRVRPSPIRWAQLDARAKHAVETLTPTHVQYVDRRLTSRLEADRRLARQASDKDDSLCFNGLPPLFDVAGRVLVYIQNRLLVTNEALGSYPLPVQARIGLERIWFRRRANPSYIYLVQTPSMAEAVSRCLGSNTNIRIAPFSDPPEPVSSASPTLKRFDYVYVATGEAHKNHALLLAAWTRLAASDCYPSLALTVGADRYPALCREIDDAASRHKLAVTNLGHLTTQEVSAVYRNAGALIYPSLLESFGLPLIEAMRQGLPILASERDYVRDVVVPAETFDPLSALSIARAVLRHRSKPQPTLSVSTAAEFLADLGR